VVGERLMADIKDERESDENLPRPLPDTWIGDVKTEYGRIKMRERMVVEHFILDRQI